MFVVNPTVRLVRRVAEIPVVNGRRYQSILIFDESIASRSGIRYAFSIP